MNFELTNEQKYIQKLARDFAEKELLPQVRERDESGEFPLEAFRKLGKTGIYGPVSYTHLDVYKRQAQHNEYQEWEHDYAHFADVAREEGFSEIAKTFDMIADIEKVHGDRFGRFADLLESEKLFVSDVKVQWMCLNCGMVIESTRAPAMCPGCKHDQGWFIRMEMVPFH